VKIIRNPGEGMSKLDEKTLPEAHPVELLSTLSPHPGNAIFLELLKPTKEVWKCR
jgi:hypothetical protein